MSKYLLLIELLVFLNLGAQKNNTNLLILGNQSNQQLFANNTNVNNISYKRVNVIQAKPSKQINRNIKPVQAIQTKNNRINNQNINKNVALKKVIIEPKNFELNNPASNDNNFSNENNNNPQFKENQTETNYSQQSTQSFIQESDNSKQVIASENYIQKIDLSISLKKNVSISKKSSYKKSKAYYNKWNKIKRKTFGKLASNKKTKFRVDLCFNWI